MRIKINKEININRTKNHRFGLVNPEATSKQGSTS